MTQNAPEITPARAAIARKAHARIAGHFGELVQGRLGPDGPVALVTLRRDRLVTEISYTPAPGPLEIDAVPNDLICQIAEKILHRCAPPKMGGVLQIMRAAHPGLGAGSSTADLLGTIRAIGAAFGHRMSAQQEAALCLEIEGAVDPLMFDAPAVFASREGRILEHLAPLPEMRVVGIFAGAARRTDPDDSGFPDVASLFIDLKHAAERGDLTAIGEIATRSAMLNQIRNPNPAWAALCSIAAKCGAHGIVVAHTGPAIGLIMSPESDVTCTARQIGSLGFGQALVL